ncbi:transposase [Streptomyces sp. NPDC001530]|uniref:transposase n=1 Tax=Streptomyces sp. NPDC001530 TaxID=3364582 RepID=UPI0036818241
MPGTLPGSGVVAHVRGLGCGRRTRYSTDLSDPEGEILRPLVLAVKPGGRPAQHTRREILNAPAYWLRAGCAWRLLPHALPPWQTAHHSWRRWQKEAVGERMPTALRERERVQPGRDPTPRAAHGGQPHRPGQ